MIEILPGPDELAAAVAAHVAGRARDAIDATGRFMLVLAGGSTPRAAYRLLASPPLAGQIRWERVHVFWSDERAVPPADPKSNYGMAKEALLAHVPIPPVQIHRIEGEIDPGLAAARYEDEIARAFGGGRPAFDLVLLGIGADGHTASLFPGQPAVEETTRLTAATEGPAPPRRRITLTLPAINGAHAASILAAGRDKAPVLARALDGPPGLDPLPVQLVRPSGPLVWWLDRAAASLLDPRARR